MEVNENIMEKIDTNDFEEIMEEQPILKDMGSTVDYMLSSNWKERFIAEYVQLRSRIDKLVDSLWECEEDSDKICGCPMQLMDLQAEKMNEYLRILSIRANMYDINIDEEIKKLNEK